MHRAPELLSADRETEFVRCPPTSSSPSPRIVQRVRQGPGRAGRQRRLQRNRERIERYGLPCMLKPSAPADSTTGLTQDYGYDYVDMGGAGWADQEFSDDAHCLACASAVVQALGQIHAAGLILHKLQPDNFLFCSSGEVVVLDFSEATTLQREHSPLENPARLGVDLRYLAPEQSGRTTRPVDYRADYYSLGALLYHMLHGAPPFTAQDPLDLIYQHLTRTPDSPTVPRSKLAGFLGEIALKLLAKDPESRYQSIEGIRADLALARACLKGEIATLPPAGGYDLPSQMRVAPRLYGRGEERARLLEAYERACQGSRELVFIEGYSGIGKTALIRETFVSMTRQRTVFVAGKCELLGRRTPYSPWTHALCALIDYALAEPEAELSIWKNKLARSLGPHANVLAELLPGLTTLLGPLSPVSVIPPREAQARLATAFGGLLEAFSSPQRPLAIFLDDVQWIDSASLHLLEQVVSDPRCQHVFLLVAARENELPPSHPVRLCLGRIAQLETLTLERIHLHALQERDLKLLVADAFAVSVDEAQELSEVVAARTGGNPFFLWQFLRAICSAELVRFDEQAVRWVWDLESIREIAQAENVVDLVLKGFQQLPECTRTILAWAACLGTEFDSDSLADLLKTSRAVIERMLEPALREEFIAVRSKSLVKAEEAGLQWFRFLHDRIQEAAHRSIPRERTPQMHLDIASMYLRQAGDGEAHENVFDIADHLNSARELLSQPAQQLERARGNLLAARKAGESAAYEAALTYSRMATSVDSEEIWRAEPALARALHRARGEYEYLDGNFAEAERWLRLAIERETDKFEQAELLHVLVVQNTLRAAYPEAIATARQALSLFGVHLPESDLATARDHELSRVDALIRGRPLSELGALPWMSSPEQMAIMKILIAMGPPCYRSHPSLWSLIVAYEVRTCLEHGLVSGASYSLPAYGGLGMHVGRLTGRDCQHLHQATLSVMERVTTPSDACIGHLMIGSSLRHWFAPLNESSEDYLRAYTTGLESGNLQYAAYGFGHDAYCRFYQGKRIALLIEEVERTREFSEKRKNRWAASLAEGVLRVLNALRRSDKEPGATLRDAEEAAYLERCRLEGNVQVLAIYLTLKAEALLHMGCDREAAAALDQAAPLSDSIATQGLYPSTQYELLRALVLASRPEPLGGDPTVSQLRATLFRFRGWAQSAPVDFRASQLLLEAELHARQGQVEEALAAFEQSIDWAQQHGQPHRAALTCLRVAAFWRPRGHPFYVQAYEARAAGFHESWGAGFRSARSSFQPEGPGRASGEPPSATAIDYRSIMNTAQALTRSVELSEVVQAIIQAVTESSGAQRTALLLTTEDGLRCAADTASCQQPSRRGADEGPALTQLPSTMIQYVMRTQSVVVGGSDEQERFAHDDYVARFRPASVLCVPIVMVGSLQGVLYLEHRELKGAFDESKLALVEFLAGSAAAAVRNADLVQKLRDDIDLRMKAEARLRESKRRRRLLVEQSPVAIQVYDARGELTESNRALEQLWPRDLAREGSAITDHPVLSRLAPEEMAKVLAGEAVDLGDHPLQGQGPASDPTRWVRVRAYGVREQLGALEHIVVMQEDISERKRVERIKGEFIASVSHELRTPLTSIRGALGLLHGGVLGPLSADAGRLVSTALTNCERLTRLVNDILDVEKLASRKVSFSLRAFGVGALMQAAVDAAVGQARLQEVRLELVATDEVCRREVVADRDRVAQVFANLISNAIKFSETRTTVSIAAKLGDGVMRFEVRDAGAGVPETFRPYLFERFAQADGSDSKQYGGTGLGLSITRELVHGMGGHIGFEPITPKGSCFFFVLPLADERA